MNKLITILSFVLLQLLSLSPPASAIGGWETIHILFSRLNSERGAQNEQEKSTGGKISPVPNGGDGSSCHVAEVTMTSNKSSSKPAAVVGDGESESSDTVTGPAFIRRGGCLNEDDLCTIAFVGRSNPFLWVSLSEKLCFWFEFWGRENPFP